MSRESVLARARVAAEEGMVDTCLVERPREGATTDPATGVITSVRDTIYSGPCRIQQAAGLSGSQQEDVGQANLLMLRLELQLPITAPALKVEDVVTLTASTRDPEMVGREWLVRSLAHKTDASARRVQISERTS